ncbi:hypothetical protein FNF27_07037 [Cafeteria roenbergensis]|uniref:Uncharacterized protein n=1 Tax=Cafeteria roenbergensis TaxID=33653 RepID=A0A5A8DVE1_CAFRO|nr:hypothetical protein FNF27_07037 [Cafeteria roenbergensis]
MTDQPRSGHILQHGPLARPARAGGGPSIVMDEEHAAALAIEEQRALVGEHGDLIDASIEGYASQDLGADVLPGGGARAARPRGESMGSSKGSSAQGAGGQGGRSMEAAARRQTVLALVGMLREKSLLARANGAASLARQCLSGDANQLVWEVGGLAALLDIVLIPDAEDEDEDEDGNGDGDELVSVAARPLSVGKSGVSDAISLRRQLRADAKRARTEAARAVVALIRFGPALASTPIGASNGASVMRAVHVALEAATLDSRWWSRSRWEHLGKAEAAIASTSTAAGSHLAEADASWVVSEAVGVDAQATQSVAAALMRLLVESRLDTEGEHRPAVDRGGELSHLLSLIPEDDMALGPEGEAGGTILSASDTIDDPGAQVEAARAAAAEEAAATAKAASGAGLGGSAPHSNSGAAASEASGRQRRAEEALLSLERLAVPLLLRLVDASTVFPPCPYGPDGLVPIHSAAAAGTPPPSSAGSPHAPEDFTVPAGSAASAATVAKRVRVYQQWQQQHWQWEDARRLGMLALEFLVRSQPRLRKALVCDGVVEQCVACMSSGDDELAAAGLRCMSVLCRRPAGASTIVLAEKADVQDRRSSLFVPVLDSLDTFGEVWALTCEWAASAGAFDVVMDMMAPPAQPPQALLEAWREERSAAGAGIAGRQPSLASAGAWAGQVFEPDPEPWVWDQRVLAACDTLSRLVTFGMRRGILALAMEVQAEHELAAGVGVGSDDEEALGGWASEAGAGASAARSPAGSAERAHGAAGGGSRRATGRQSSPQTSFARSKPGADPRFATDEERGVGQSCKDVDRFVVSSAVMSGAVPLLVRMLEAPLDSRLPALAMRALAAIVEQPAFAGLVAEQSGAAAIARVALRIPAAEAELEWAAASGTKPPPPLSGLSRGMTTATLRELRFNTMRALARLANGGIGARRAMLRPSCLAAVLRLASSAAAEEVRFAAQALAGLAAVPCPQCVGNSRVIDMLEWRQKDSRAVLNDAAPETRGLVDWADASAAVAMPAVEISAPTGPAALGARESWQVDWSRAKSTKRGWSTAWARQSQSVSVGADGQVEVSSSQRASGPQGGPGALGRGGSLGADEAAQGSIRRWMEDREAELPASDTSLPLRERLALEARAFAEQAQTAPEGTPSAPPPWLVSITMCVRCSMGMGSLAGDIAAATLSLDAWLRRRDMVLGSSPGAMDILPGAEKVQAMKLLPLPGREGAHEQAARRQGAPDRDSSSSPAGAAEALERLALMNDVVLSNGQFFSSAPAAVAAGVVAADSCAVPARSVPATHARSPSSPAGPARPAKAGPTRRCRLSRPRRWRHSACAGGTAIC